MRTLTSVPISFEVAGGATQHAPTVSGRFDGLETRLVLDTGSEVHVLTKELVDQLGLAVEDGEEGVDHSGATMPSWTVGDVPLRLGELELMLRGSFAIPAPPPFPGWGIGGILSPQHLHPEAATVIDLDRDELLLVEADDSELAAWLEARSPELRTLVLERDPTFSSVVVPAAVEPYPERPVMLNTGGSRTEFSSVAVPGLAEPTDERLGAGVSGADVLGAAAGRATVLVAGHQLPIEALAVRKTMRDPQGMVGAGDLRGTVLTVGADLRRPVVWQVPQP